MIVDVPAAKPDAIPPLVMPATVVLLLLHVPPVVASAKVVLAPSQTDSIPVIGVGLGLIVTVTLPSGPQQPPAACARK
jgi:hypothetical protein